MKKTEIVLSVFFYGLLFAVILLQMYVCPKEMAVSGNFDSAERVKLEDSSVYVPVGEIGIKVYDEKCIILKNGHKAQCEKKDGVMIFSVREGDVFSGDVRSADGGGIFCITKVSDNVLCPGEGAKFVLDSGVGKIFEVKVRRD